jgi:thimet oligopeptidase
MRSLFTRITIASVSGLFLLSTSFAGMMGFPTIENFEDRAEQYGVRLTIPDFPGTAEEIQAAAEIILNELKTSGDNISALTADQLTFENTFRAYDLALHSVYNKVQPIYLVKNTSPDTDLRNAASETMKRFEEAEIEFNYREDIYLKLKAFADSDPILPPEDQRLMDDILMEFRRLGYDLALEERQKAEALKKRLTDISSDFIDNIRESKQSLFFSAEELKGLPASFLASVETPEGTFEIKSNVTNHVSNIYKFAESETTRQKVYIARMSRTMESNIDLLKEMVTLRSQLAKTLGYQTWADYRIETRMAKDGDTAVHFLNDLVERMEPKFQSEVSELLSLKKEDTQNPEAILNCWDVSYYQEKQNQILYELDAEKLKDFFPYEKCVRGLFQVYETIFGIEITEIENPTLWDPNVSLYVVTDVESEKPLGLFYIDPFPREGKYNHFAKFDVINGALLADGTYQRATVALVCNFPTPEENQPSLLSFSQVESLFHEFGHAMHSILSESKYNRFSGTSVPRDFVETPAQVMEYWLREAEILNLFAANWQDQSIELPLSWIEKINQAQKAHAGIAYRKQMALALIDMTLHHQTDIDETAQNLVEITNDIAAKVAFPFPEGTAFVAAFGHLDGYDAGYYGYAWADVIAADFAQQFRDAPEGFLDKEVGMRLRKEVFEKGNSRDINESVRRFLGREPEMDAFVESIGLKKE